MEYLYLCHTHRGISVRDNVTYGDWHTDVLHGYAGLLAILPNRLDNLKSHFTTHSRQILRRCYRLAPCQWGRRVHRRRWNRFYWFTRHTVRFLLLFSHIISPNPDVASILRTNAPWGLARISQNGRLANQNPNALTFTYRYDSSAGAGVDIYVIGGFFTTYNSQFYVLSDL